ncbi:MAG: 5-formyltetrahydrofolate cyclo-ligase [DPANN group archaeon]|nr:5-formyltetrahydrofolate cyclo-ligase [DPANN group archaeon]
MKQRLRNASRQRRIRRSRQQLVQFSRAICHRLEALPLYADATSVLFYASKEDEVQTHELIRRASTSKQVLLPRVLGKHGLSIHRISSFDDLTPGRFGILEPPSIGKVSPKSIGLALIPGFAFDREGHRIGYGLGYYDRLLRQFKGTTIGLCFEADLHRRVPCQEHDVPVDLVVTEERVIWTGKKKRPGKGQDRAKDGSGPGA